MTRVYKGGRVFRRLYESKIKPVGEPAMTRSGLKRGDRILIARKPSSEELESWSDAWLPSMDRTVGSVGTVDYVAGPDSVCVNFDDATKRSGFYYPASCVEIFETLG